MLVSVVHVHTSKSNTTESENERHYLNMLRLLRVWTSLDADVMNVQ